MGLVQTCRYLIFPLRFDSYANLKGRLKRHDGIITDFSEGRGFSPLASFCLSVSLLVLQLPPAVQRRAREGELGTST